MSNLSITMTGPDSAQIRFSSACRGDYLAVGSEAQHVINVTDGDFLRKATGDLFKLRSMKYKGQVSLKVGDSPRIRIDETLWHDLADALLAFTINVDASKVLADDVAA